MEYKDYYLDTDYARYANDYLEENYPRVYKRLKKNGELIDFIYLASKPGHDIFWIMVDQERLDGSISAGKRNTRISQMKEIAMGEIKDYINSNI